jgi:hypothetical protein
VHPRKYITSQQREALWKWRWLGVRDSTPAFKLSLVLLGLAAIGILLKAL